MGRIQLFSSGAFLALILIGMVLELAESFYENPFIPNSSLVPFQPPWAIGGIQLFSGGALLTLMLNPYPNGAGAGKVFL